MKSLASLLAAIAVSTCSLTANAAFTFSDVQVTSHSVSFKIDGDMTGYAAPAYGNQFSIRYSGGLWVGGNNFMPNTWNQSVFDNKSLADNGNTGGFNLTYNYTWSEYGSSLADAVATNRLITVDWGTDYLDPLAVGSLAFVWGNGNRIEDHTVLQEVRQWNQSTVPEPATIALVGMSLAGLGLMRRRKSL